MPEGWCQAEHSSLRLHLPYLLYLWGWSPASPSCRSGAGGAVSPGLCAGARPPCRSGSAWLGRPAVYGQRPPAPGILFAPPRPSRLRLQLPAVLPAWTAPGLGGTGPEGGEQGSLHSGPELGDPQESRNSHCHFVSSSMRCVCISSPGLCLAGLLEDSLNPKPRLGALHCVPTTVLVFLVCLLPPNLHQPGSSWGSGRLTLCPNTKGPISCPGKALDV